MTGQVFLAFMPPSQTRALDHDDEIRCSITLLGSRGIFDGALDGSAAKALRAVAGEVSLSLGA